jgi:hypothetical protein
MSITVTYSSGSPGEKSRDRIRFFLLRFTNTTCTRIVATARRVSLSQYSIRTSPVVIPTGARVWHSAEKATHINGAKIHQRMGHLVGEMHIFEASLHDFARMRSVNESKPIRTGGPRSRCRLTRGHVAANDTTATRHVRVRFAGAPRHMQADGANCPIGSMMAPRNSGTPRAIERPTETNRIEIWEAL